MSVPMTSSQMKRALEQEGCKLSWISGWETNNRNHKGAWGEVHGVLIHHTAGVSKTMPQFCFNGTAALPGPLCHAVATKAGRTFLVGNGRANHAGLIAANAMDSLKAEDGRHPAPGPDSVDGNRQLYGLEIENMGDGKDPYPREQYDQSVRWAAAICRFHGWTAESIGAHKEVTRRKIDPSFSMEAFRAKVAERLRHPALWDPSDEVTVPKPVPPKEESSAMEYTHLSRRVPLIIPANQSRPVFWEVEFDDEPADHGDGGRTVLDGGRYTGAVNVYLPATPMAVKLTVQMTHELADGSVSASTLADIWTDAEEGTQAVPVTGEIPADRKLFVEIHNHSATQITVPRVDIRLLSQAL